MNAPEEGELKEEHQIMTKIFLSYACDDDEPFVRRLYEDLINAIFDVWFDRVVRRQM